MVQKELQYESLGREDERMPAQKKRLVADKWLRCRVPAQFLADFKRIIEADMRHQTMSGALRTFVANYMVEATAIMEESRWDRMDKEIAKLKAALDKIDD